MTWKLSSSRRFADFKSEKEERIREEGGGEVEMRRGRRKRGQMR